MEWHVRWEGPSGGMVLIGGVEQLVGGAFWREGLDWWSRTFGGRGLLEGGS